jgi:hypothetical protein
VDDVREQDKNERKSELQNTTSLSEKGKFDLIYVIDNLSAIPTTTGPNDNEQEGSLHLIELYMQPSRLSNCCKFLLYPKYEYAIEGTSHPLIFMKQNNISN